MKLKNHIPNFITCLNLTCGCISIGLASTGQLERAAYFVIGGMLFDFADGMTARLLNVKSDIGKELDSFSDLVTFGVAPSFIIFQLIKINIKDTIFLKDSILPYCAFLIAIFSSLRLAKFNLDLRQTHSFIGLPTPANGLFFISFPLILSPLSTHYKALSTLLNNPAFLIILVVIFSYLLVSRIKMFSLKFKTYNWKDNKLRYSFLIIAIILIIGLQFISLPLIIIIYILLSLTCQKTIA